MPKVYLALGSNMGEKARHIIKAFIEIDNLPRTKVKRISQIMTSAPEGGPPEHEDYMNGACLIETELSPQELLGHLAQIEKKEGRIRGPKWGPRPLDIDIIFYEDEIIETETLTIPHPRMHSRLFVLRPLLELAADFIHPALNKSIRQLTKELEGAAKFKIISVVGPIGAGKSTAALELALSLEVPFVPDPEHELAGELMRFYRNRRENALELQRAFLHARSRELLNLSEKVRGQPAVVLAFFMDNEQVFSRLTLTDAEKRIYEEEYEKASKEVPGPDLVIYLKASPETLAERIRKRGSRLGKEITPEYLKGVADAFEEYMKEYKKAPVLEYDTETCDFSEGGPDTAKLVKDVKEKLNLR